MKYILSYSLSGRSRDLHHSPHVVFNMQESNLKTTSCAITLSFRFVKITSGQIRISKSDFSASLCRETFLKLFFTRHTFLYFHWKIFPQHWGKTENRSSKLIFIACNKYVMEIRVINDNKKYQLYCEWNLTS